MRRSCGRSTASASSPSIPATWRRWGLTTVSSSRTRTDGSSLSSGKRPAPLLDGVRLVGRDPPVHDLVPVEEPA